MGDIIYSLPTILSLGGGIIYIPIHQFFKSLYHLLMIQPCISEVRLGCPKKVDYDLDDFRKNLKPNTNIADMHLDYFERDRSGRDSKWLTVDSAVETPGKPVIINKTFRYKNDAFSWMKVRDKYRNKACFVGLSDEHAVFQHQLEWNIPHVKTDNLLEVARVIAGCQLFIGNQSSAYAIAEGLRKPAVLEVWPFDPNCIFKRPGVFHGWDANVNLPDL